MKAKVIVNADDFGADTRVNDAVMELVADRKITSLSLLANGGAIDEAIEMAMNNTHISFAVHLNVSVGGPVGSSEDCRLLLNEQGLFTYKSPASALSSDLIPQIEKEWQAQIAFLVERGVSISHLDSECHLHTHPSLISVVRRMQALHGIKWLRNTKNVYSDKEQVGGIRRVKKRLWTSYMKCVGFRMTDAFTDLSAWHEKQEAGKLRYARIRTIEIMVHPGVGEYAEETNLLYSKSAEELFGKQELISYHDLNACSM